MTYSGIVGILIVLISASLIGFLLLCLWRLFLLSLKTLLILFSIFFLYKFAANQSTLQSIDPQLIESTVSEGLTVAEELKTLVFENFPEYQVQVRLKKDAN